VGDANIDLVTTPVPAVRPEESAEVAFTERVGGNAANAAAACARLGLPTLLAGRVGRDHWGRRLAEMLASLGVGCALREVEGRTALTVAVTFEGGRRSFLGDQGDTNQTVEAGDVPPEALDARFLLRAGYWYTPRLMGGPTAELFRRARSRGATTLLDVGWDHEGWTGPRLSTLDLVLAHTDVLFANAAEARRIARLPRAAPERAARAILGLGAGAVVLHLGARGSRLVSADEDVSAPAVRAGGVRDPRGTGDVFTAAFIAARHRGLGSAPALSFANAAAALHLSGRTFPPLELVEGLASPLGGARR
jgi:sugar/nucleoside kinase (ribokinase family)